MKKSRGKKLTLSRETVGNLQALGIAGMRPNDPVQLYTAQEGCSAAEYCSQGYTCQGSCDYSCQYTVCNMTC